MLSSVTLNGQRHTRKVRWSRGEMWSAPYTARVFTQNCGDFARVRNSRVLIYWPHGFGDWVHLSYLLPLLEPSNSYWITRFGDHNAALYDGSLYVTPLYTGVQSLACGNGKRYGLEHLDLDYASIDGGQQSLQLPFSVAEACERHGIDTVLWSNYPEVVGRRAFPYHTKIRSLIQTLVGARAERVADLSYPLNCAIAFEPPAWVLSWVEARLQSYAGFRGRRLCLIGRTGYTSIGKNWGHQWREDLPPGKQREGEECRAFMRLLRRKDPRWMFLSMEDRSRRGYHSLRSRGLQCYSYADLFGSVAGSQIPFALVMKALIALAELAIGVPAGPYHLCMARGNLPTIGVWIEHLPSWFDEPSSTSIHVISRNVRDRELHKRCGSFSNSGHLSFRCVWLGTRTIAGQDVLNAYEELSM
jgi:hypothetical protein